MGTVLCAFAFGTFGSAEIPANAVGGPANDDLANATDLSLYSFFNNGDRQIVQANGGATAEVGEPSTPNGATVWYTWTAPSSATITFDTFKSPGDTLLNVYAGTSYADLSLVASSDDTSCNSQSWVSFNATAGTTYKIQVDDDTSTPLLHFTWTGGWSPGNTLPGNDSFFGAQPIPNTASSQTAGTTLGSDQ